MNEIHEIRAGLAVSISDLKKNPSGVMKQAGSRIVAILSHNKPQSYLVPAEIFEQINIEELLEDLELAAVVRSRMEAKRPSVKVSLDEL